MRLTSTTWRRLTTGAFLMVAGVVAMSSVTYACVPLATLHANPTSAAPGSTVQLFGKYYSGGGSGAAAGGSPIEVHLNTRTGPVIASFPAGSTTIEGTWTIPASMAGGEYTLVATQYTATGDAVSGTPGRATVVVSGVGNRTAAEATFGSAPVASNHSAATTSGPVASGPAASARAVPAPAASAAPPVRLAPPAIDGSAGALQGGVGSSPVGGTGGVPVPSDVSTPPVGVVEASAAPVVPAPEAAVGESAPPVDRAAVTIGVLQPSPGSSTSAVPVLALAAGVALVLLGVGALVKSGRNVLGGHRVTPLAG